MITEIFLPEKIGTRRILAQRVLGIAIQEDSVQGVLAYAKRSGAVVEKLLKEKIDKAGPEDQQVIASLKRLVSQVKQYDQIRIAIPSSLVVFKELEVPFLDPEKIRMILDYEIESMLPFSVASAVVDFIITKANKSSNSSQILVAAIRNQDLQTILDLYTAAGIQPASITIDLFALYSLYQQISEYKQQEGGCALVNLGFNSTEISFIEHGQLRLRRHMPRGFNVIIQEISNDTNTPVDQILKQLQTIGIKPTGNNDYDRMVQKHIIDFFHDIQFTLNSFSLKLNYFKGVQKILFTGPVLSIIDLMKFSSDLLQIPCEIFDVKKLFLNKLITYKGKKDAEQWSDYIMALGTALPSEEQAFFDLRRKTFVLPQHQLIRKQLIAAVGLIVVMMVVLGLNGYMQLNSLKARAAHIEEREIVKLSEIIPRKERPAKAGLAVLVKKAEEALKENTELWAPFEKERIRPLEILLELTNIMDKGLFNVDIQEISLTEQPGFKRESGTSALVIEVDGYFASKRGTGSHFNDFKELEKRFNNSALLVPIEQPMPRSAEDKGVQFSISLKKKED